MAVKKTYLGKTPDGRDKFALDIDADPTIEVQVGAAADDGDRGLKDSLKLFDATSLTAAVGANVWSGYQYHWDAWFRFASVPVPHGAVIGAAYLMLRAYTTNSVTTVNANILGEDADNPLVVTSYDDYSSRAKTAAIDWNNIGDWAAGTIYNSPSIVPIIQAIVNRPGFVSANAMQIFWMDDGSSIGVASCTRVACTYEDDPSHAAILHIEYTVVVAPTLKLKMIPESPMRKSRLYKSLSLKGG